MKIDPYVQQPWIDVPEATRNVAPQGDRTGGRGGHEGEESEADSVNVRFAADGSDVRGAKVAALQQAVASGRYSVSADAIANAMVREWLG